MRIPGGLTALMLVLSLATYCNPALADDTLTGDKGSDMALDLIIARPAGLVATVIGGAVFLVGLPITLPSGQVGESACALVGRPFAFTFTRRLGELDECPGGQCNACASGDQDSDESDRPPH